MTDTKQQAAVLRQSKTAQAVRRQFPEGTRVRPNQSVYAGLTTTGVVKRHIPMTDAQGGVLVVEWDNGTTGRMSPINLEVMS
jgi:hypothetical protein